MRARLLILGLLTLALAPAVQAPAALAAPLDPLVQLNAMSCPVAGGCTAVGTYRDGVGHGQGLLISESHGRWAAAVQAQLPANQGKDPMNPSRNTGIADVSCVSPGNCAAVGVYTDATNSDRGLLLSERHGRWSKGVEAQLPANVLRPNRHAATADAIVLLGVACTAPGDCYAVGNYVTASNTLEPLIITERNGRWGAGRVAPMPAGAAVRGQKAVLYAITCSGARECTTTGSYVDRNGEQQAMVLTERDGRWISATEGSAPAGASQNPGVTPVAVSCAAPGECAVAGNFQDGRADALGYLLSEVGGAWQPGVQAPLPPSAAPPTSYNAQTTVVASVSCPAAAACSGAGSFTDGYGNTQGLLLDQRGGTWQPGQEVQLPSNAIHAATKQTAGLDTISCGAPGDCVAGGTYTDTAANNDSLLVTESGGVWQTGVEVPLPHGASITQYSAVDSVVCTGVGDCTALGTYNDTYGETLPFAVSEHNGSWGTAVRLPTPAPSALQVRLSLRLMLTPTGHLATVSAIHHSGLFRLPYVILAPGRLSVTWYTTSGGQRVTVASASVRSRSVSTGRLTLRLTHAGRLLFDHRGKLTLSSRVVLAPRRGRPLSATTSFRLG